MVVSFKGISNIYVSKSVDENQFSTDWIEGVDKEPRILPRKNTQVTLKCTLSDDDKGSDLGDLYKLIGEDLSYRHPLEYDAVEIKLNHNEITNKEEKLNFAKLTFNGKDVASTNNQEKEKIPFITYIYNLTSKLLEDSNIDPKQKEAISMLNETSQNAIDELI